MTRYEDLHEMPEDDRITLIGEQVMRGKTVGVFIDNEPEKIARYIQKITARFPAVMVRAQVAGPTPEVVTLQFGLRQ